VNVFTVQSGEVTIRSKFGFESDLRVRGDFLRRLSTAVELAMSRLCASSVVTLSELRRCRWMSTSVRGMFRAREMFCSVTNPNHARKTSQR